MAIVKRITSPIMRRIMALAPPRAKVYVFRHGSTDRNRGGVGLDQVRGHDDVPMTPAGENEVRVTAYQVADVKLERIYCSDLQRAVRSAEIMSDENVKQPVCVPLVGLRSWDMGAGMEGQVTTPEVVEKIRAWVRNDTAVPPGGESFRDFVGRLLTVVGPIFQDALAGGGTVAIMAHGRCAQVIDFWCASGCDEECMHREFSEWLAEEPDTVPPGGGIYYKADQVGWEGQVIPTGQSSLGTRIAAGSHALPANEMATRAGVIAS